jgi:hypothetical protein
MKVLQLGLIPALVMLNFQLLAQTPEVRSSKAAYKIGEDISITFTNGPGNPKDWIGIYPTNVQPGSASSTIWNYVDGTHNGDTGNANGVITFTNGLAKAGSWTAYLLENDGYNILASVDFNTVPGPSVTTDKAFYKTNETIVVTFSNGPGNAKDWIGLYRDGEQPGGPASTLWAYVNGSHTAGTGIASGTITFTNASSIRRQMGRLLP